MIFDMTKRKGGAPTPTNPVAEDNDVIFIDYDGTIRYSYTKAEFAQLSELPPNPDHTDMGLVAEGWNWSLANAKSYVSKYRWLVIGQTYHTASGAMEIDVELRSGRMNPTVGLCVVGTVNIEWGDGTEDTVLTGTSITTAVYASHEYADSGKYTIRIKNSEGVRSFYRITGHSSNGSLLFCKSSASSINSNMVYHYSVNAIRLGKLPDNQSNKSLGGDAIKGLGLKYITIPEGYTCPAGTAQHFGSGCMRLIAWVAPKSCGGPYLLGAAADNYYVKMLSYPETASPTSIGYALRGYQNLKRLSLPSNITSFGTAGIASCHSLIRLTIPENVTTITSQFSNFGLKELHSTPLTPPTLGVSLADCIPDDCIVFVPSSEDHNVLTAYREATNWSTIGSDRIVEEEAL